MSKPLSEEERDQILPWSDEVLAMVRDSLDLFRERILGNDELRAVIQGDLYYHETHYAGLVDADDRVNFYDGQVRVIDPDLHPVHFVHGAQVRRAEQVATIALPR